MRRKRLKATNMDVRSICAIAGVIIGLLTAMEFRLKGPGTFDARVSATAIGFLLGIVLGLAVLDIIHVIQDGGEEEKPNRKVASLPSETRILPAQDVAVVSNDQPY